MKGATPHQLKAMVALARLQAETGKPVDLDQLLENLPWKPSKESAQFVIRALVTKGFVEKVGRELRRGRTRVCLKATEKALDALDPTRVKALVPGATKAAEEGSMEVETGTLEEVDIFDPGVPEELDLE